MLNTHLKVSLEIAVWLMDLKPVLYGNIEGWDGVGGEREVQEEGDLWTAMIHAAVWQKPTQYC